LSIALVSAKRIGAWLERLGVRTLFRERGSSWENGRDESFNGKLRDDLLMLNQTLLPILQRQTPGGLEHLAGPAPFYCLHAPASSLRA